MGGAHRNGARHQKSEIRNRTRLRTNIRGVEKNEVFEVGSGGNGIGDQCSGISATVNCYDSSNAVTDCYQ
jgi:hypothetical protein